MENQRIVILHIVNRMVRAGVETFIMNCFRHFDRTRFSFMFLVKTTEPGDYDIEIRELGGKIYYVPRFSGFNARKYKKSLTYFFQNHPEIDIVHCHQGSSAALDIEVAKRFGKKTIAHSHNTYLKNFFNPYEISYRLFSYRTRFLSDVFIGCSEAALLSRYGRNIAQRKKAFVVNNAIDLQKFCFSSKKRDGTRRRLGIPENALVCLFVGRLTKVKNPLFALKAFRSVFERDRNSYLLIAGRGELCDTLQKEIVALGLKDNAFLLGNVSNIDEIMSAADCLAMPSSKEGFPVTLVEAQCSGLTCLVSDLVTNEVKLSDRVFFLPVSRKSISSWEETMNACRQSAHQARPIPDSVINKFDVVSMTKNLEKIYLEMMSPCDCAEGA